MHMSRNRLDDDTPSYEIDRHVGRRVREIRKLRGVPVEDIAAALGVSPRQFARFESCNVPMSIGVLYTISEYFNVPVTLFFPVSGRIVRRNDANANRLAELLDLFKAISDPDLKRALVGVSHLLKSSLAGVEGVEGAPVSLVAGPHQRKLAFLASSTTISSAVEGVPG